MPAEDSNNLRRSLRYTPLHARHLRGTLKGNFRQPTQLKRFSKYLRSSLRFLEVYKGIDIFNRHALSLGLPQSLSSFRQREVL